MKDQLLFSCKYRFLYECSKLQVKNINHKVKWTTFLKQLNFKRLGEEIIIFWKKPNIGSVKLKLNKLYFCFSGDTNSFYKKQKEMEVFNTSEVRIKNENYIKEVLNKMIELASYEVIDQSLTKRINAERIFHNDWAEKEEIEKINVLKNNEVCTAPEMRYITKRLGDLRGKRVLDVGCGLGEASIYFALKGAKVTALDLSNGMLKVTKKLAKLNNVKVRTILASAEKINMNENEKFDIIYAGNLFHHVDIESTLQRFLPYLSKGAKLVSWDPIVYNPIINFYRYVASDVRTDDEHPLTINDIKLFKKYFSKVETKFTWLSTLFIFILMLIVERRNPNKERYWKVIVNEGDKWTWLYKPLERIDNLILKMFPILRFLCWNVIVIATI